MTATMRTIAGETTADGPRPEVAIPEALRIIGHAALYASGLAEQLGALRDLQGDSVALMRAMGSLNDVASELTLLWKLNGGGPL